MDDFDDDDDDLEEDGFYLDCHLAADGQCTKAGSEECDWDCPQSHGEFYAGSRLWLKKHNAGLPVEGCECSDCRSARAIGRQG